VDFPVPRGYAGAGVAVGIRSRSLASFSGFPGPLIVDLVLIPPPPRQKPRLARLFLLLSSPDGPIVEDGRDGIC